MNLGGLSEDNLQIKKLSCANFGFVLLRKQSCSVRRFKNLLFYIFGLQLFGNFLLFYIYARLSRAMFLFHPVHMFKLAETKEASEASAIGEALKALYK